MKIGLSEIEPCRRGTSNIPVCSFGGKEQGQGQLIDRAF